MAAHRRWNAIMTKRWKLDTKARKTNAQRPASDFWNGPLSPVRTLITSSALAQSSTRHKRRPFLPIKMNSRTVSRLSHLKYAHSPPKWPPANLSSSSSSSSFFIRFVDKKKSYRCFGHSLCRVSSQCWSFQINWWPNSRNLIEFTTTNSAFQIGIGNGNND